MGKQMRSPFTNFWKKRKWFENECCCQHTVNILHEKFTNKMHIMGHETKWFRWNHGACVYMICISRRLFVNRLSIIVVVFPKVKSLCQAGQRIFGELPHAWRTKFFTYHTITVSFSVCTMLYEWMQRKHIEHNTRTAKNMARGDSDRPYGQFRWV